MLIDFMTQQNVAPFFYALCAVGVIAVFELFSVLIFGVAGMSHALDHAIDLDHAPEFPGVDWLLVKGMPLMCTLVAMLTGFGLGGVALQGLVHAQTGALVPLLIASAVGTVGALVVVRAVGAVFSKSKLSFDSNAVSIQSLVGRTALHLSPSAAVGDPGQAEVFDCHGTRHYVFIEPEANALPIPEAAKVLLISYNGHTFVARVAL